MRKSAPTPILKIVLFKGAQCYIEKTASQQIVFQRASVVSQSYVSHGREEGHILPLSDAGMDSRPAEEKLASGRGGFISVEGWQGKRPSLHLQWKAKEIELGLAKSFVQETVSVLNLGRKTPQ